MIDFANKNRAQIKISENDIFSTLPGEESAFSMLKYIYTDEQTVSMVNLIITTLMLRYNKD